MLEQRRFYRPDESPRGNHLSFCTCLLSMHVNLMLYSTHGELWLGIKPEMPASATMARGVVEMIMDLRLRKD